MIDVLNFFKSMVLMVWLVLGLYFGISGYLSVDVDASLRALEEVSDDTTTVVTVNNIEYSSPKQYNLIKDKAKIEAYFTYLKDFPDNMCVMVTALSFGVLGSITLLFKELAFDADVSIVNARIFSIPFLGMLSGLFILGLTYLVPTILVAGEKTIRPEVLIFLSLFAGLFCGKFYEWLYEGFGRIFPSGGALPSGVKTSTTTTTTTTPAPGTTGATNTPTNPIKP